MMLFPVGSAEGDSSEEDIFSRSKSKQQMNLCYSELDAKRRAAEREPVLKLRDNPSEQFGQCLPFRLTPAMLYNEKCFVSCINSLPSYRNTSRQELRVAYYQRLQHAGISMEEAKRMPRKPFVFEFKFALNSDYVTLCKAVSELLPVCQECHSPKSELCIEECCKGSNLYCCSCEGGDHFLHRCNDPSLLFVDSSLLPNFQEKLQLAYSSIEVLLRQGIAESEKVIQVHTAMIQSLESEIQRLRVLQSSSQQYWHTDLYRTLQRYMRGELTLSEAKQLFAKCANGISLHEKAIRYWKMSSPNDSEQATARVQQAFVGYTNSTSELNKKLKLLLTEGKHIETVEQLVRGTSKQKYIDVSHVPLPAEVFCQSDRSISVDANFNYLQQLMVHPKRLSLYSLSKSNTTWTPVQTLYLTTNIQISQLPYGMLSLNIDVRTPSNNTPYLKLLQQQLPATLTRLEIRMSNNDYVFDFSGLPNLKWLVLQGKKVQAAEMRKLLQLAIRNRMRMLLLRNCRLQQLDQRCVNKHSLAYARKLLQVAMMNRARHIRKQRSSLFQELLEASESPNEVNPIPFPSLVKKKKLFSSSEEDS